MPRALPDHGVERVREEAAWAAVEAADVLEVPGFFQVPFDEAQVASAVQLVPDGNRLIWKATIRERNDEWGPNLEDAPDLSHDLYGTGQVVDGDAAAHAVELRIGERKL